MSKILDRFKELHYGIEVWQNPTLLKDSISEFNKLEEQIESALKLQDKINQRDTSLYKDALKTIEKIQYGKELDKWDSSNLQYTIEDLLTFIISQKIKSNSRKGDES